MLLAIRDKNNLGEAGFPILRSIAYFLTILLVTYAADAMGIMISSIVKSTNTAMKVMPFVFVVQMAFADVLLDISGKLSIISWFTISRWGSDAIRTIAFDRDTIDATNLANEVLNQSHNNPVHFVLCWLVLIEYSVLFLMIGCLALRSVDKDQR